MFAALLILAEAAAGVAPMPAFLAGCWQEEGDNGHWTEECWTDSRGGVMIGSGRTGSGDSVAHWEWMRIERGADGAIGFFASPKGAPPVRFKAMEVTGRSATFVNSGHDYPQRVHYVLTEAGLDAEISLADGSRPGRWRYTRRPAPRE